MRPDTALYTAYDEHRPIDPAEPERLLMLAILRAAMEDIKKRGEPHRDARRYFLSPEENYLYSFRSICRYLNLCPKTILTTIGLQGEELGANGAKTSQANLLAA